MLSDSGDLAAELVPDIGPPHMAECEIAILSRLMREHKRSYLEFGSGGSTLLAARLGVETIVSVESDLAWARAVGRHAEIAPGVRRGDITILYADIGPTKAFGAPASADSIARWPAYVRMPWAEWNRRLTLPDLVLVDGRFRVASCLSVLVAWALAGEHAPPPPIVIHDVVPERTSYDRLKIFFDVAEAADTLRVLRAKAGVPGLLVLSALLEAQFDPA